MREVEVAVEKRDIWVVEVVVEVVMVEVEEQDSCVVVGQVGDSGGSGQLGKRAGVWRRPTCETPQLQPDHTCTCWPPAAVVVVVGEGRCRQGKVA